MKTISTKSTMYGNIMLLVTELRVRLNATNDDINPTKKPIQPTMRSRLRLRPELVPKHFFIRGLSVVDILEFCLLVLGNLTGPGSLPQGRKLLLPLLQDGGNSTS